MNIVLRDIPFPDEILPLQSPSISVTEYRARLDALYERAQADWVVVYGDREHNANLLFLCGYDPRFEEALLLVGPEQSAYLVVGNEGIGYVPLTTPWIIPLLAQSMSLAGQPRDIAPRLGDVLAGVGIGAGNDVAVVGWKYLEHEETDDVALPAYVPAYVISTINSLVGSTGSVHDATAVMMHPAHGLRAENSAAQIAVFEYAAMRASAYVFRMVHGTRAGMREHQAAALMGYEGDPLSAHVMYATGKDTIVGLRSPTHKLIEIGDGVTTAVSLWGSLACRAGMVLETPDVAFFKQYAAPYFGVLATWYESLQVGATGGEVFERVTSAFDNLPFHSALNPGHLVSYDEWVHSPIRKGSNDKLASGMALQSDIIPTPLPAGRALNCEDTLVLADINLRRVIAATYPDMWARIMARRRFMDDALGIRLCADVLPLSVAPAYLPPFWLCNTLVCAAES